MNQELEIPGSFVETKHETHWAHLEPAGPFMTGHWGCCWGIEGYGNPWMLMEAHLLEASEQYTAHYIAGFRYPQSLLFLFFIHFSQYPISPIPPSSLILYTTESSIPHEFPF